MIQRRLITVVAFAALLSAPALGQSAAPRIVNSRGYLNGTSLTVHTTAAFNSVGASTLVAFVSTLPVWNNLPVAINGVTDNLGNTWHVLTGPTTWTGASYPLVSAIYYVNSPAASGTHTLTVSLSNPAPLVAHIFAVSGSDITGPPVYSAITGPNAGGTSAAVTTASITVPANSLLLSWVKNETDAGATALGGYSLDLQSTSYLWAESQTASATGSYAGQFQYSTPIGWQTAIVGVRPSGSAPLPPTPTILSTPTNPTNQTTATFSFSDTQGGVSFLCQLDSGGFNACTSPVGYSNLTQGNHSFSVKAQDTGGNQSAPAGYTWTISTGGAGAPLMISSRGYLNGNSLTVHTTAAFNSAGASTLVAFVSTPPVWNSLPVAINGVTDNLGNTWHVLTGPTTWTGASYPLISAIYYVNTPVTNGTHTLTVSLSNPAPLVSHIFAVSGSDVTGPPVYSAITGPSAGGASAAVTTASIAVPANSLLLSWVKNETDASATALGGYSLDPQSTSYLWAESQTASATGSYAGQFQYSTPIGWQTAIVGVRPSGSAPLPPTPTIVSTPANPTNQTTATFSFSDTQGGVSFLCQLDSGGFNACTSPVGYTNLTQGNHSFLVKAQDTGGNQSAPAGYTWTISTGGAGAPLMISSRGYLNGTSLTAHTTAAFNSVGASTLVAFVSTMSVWNSLLVAINGVTDNLGNTWHVLTGPTTWTGASYPLISAIYYVNTPATSGTHTLTVSLSNPAPLVAHIFAVSGSDVTGPPVYSAITGPSTGGTSAAVTTASIAVPSNSLLLSWVKNETDGTATALGGYSLDSQSTSYLWAESQTASATGSYAGQFQYSTPIGWQTAIVGVRPSGSAPLPPTPTIVSTPANPTSQTTATFSFSDTQGGVSFLCQLDSGGFNACTSPIGYTNLTQGNHSFLVKAQDTGGNQSAPAGYTWTISTGGAGAPLMISSRGYLNGTSLTAHTTAAFNSVGASTLVAFVSTMSVWNSLPVAINGVTDNLGNTWHVLTGPTTWTGASYPLVSAIYYLNSPATSGTHTLTVSLSNPAPLVAHILAVSGSDVTGPPVYSAITGPSTGGTSAAVTTASIAVPANSLLLSWVKNETDGTATALGGYSLDPQSTSYLWAESQTASATGSYAGQFQYNSPIGWQTAIVGVRPSGSAPLPPTPTIVSTPTNPTSQTTATFSFSDTQGGVSFLCQLDSGGFNACTSPLTYPNLTQGNHSFSVKAQDASGNQSAPAAYTWTISTATGPTASVVSSSGYLNATALSTHTIAPLNSVGASTLIAYISTHPVWNNLPVSVSGLTDNLGNTWHLLTGPTTWAGTSETLMSAIYYVNAPLTSATHTITVTLSNPSSLVVHIFAVSGSDVIGSPIYSAIADPGPGGVSSAVASMPIAVPANGLLLGWAKNETDATASAVGGYSLDPQSTSYLWAESQTALVAGSYTSQFQYSTAIGWQTAIIGLKPSNAPIAFSQTATINLNASASITLTAVSRSNFSLNYSVLTTPTHGVLSGVAPNLTYTPNANYQGNDAFTFKANDGTADSNVATVSISVQVPHPAVVSSRGYLNGTSLTVHTTADFNSAGASTLVAFVSTMPVWNNLPVAISGVTDNLGNTWHLLTGPTTWTGASYPLVSAIYYVNTPVTSGTQTLTVSLSNPAPLVAHIFAVSGSDVTGPPIYSAITGPSTGNTSTAVTTASITVPANSLLLSWVKNETDAGATALGGYSLDPQSTSYLWAESQTASAAGSYAGQFQYSAPIGWQAAIVGLQPAH